MKRELTIDDDKNDMNKKHKINHHISTLRNKDDFILIWYHEQPAPPEINTLLESLFNDVYYFQESADCLTYIQSLNVKDHAFLIVSPSCMIIDDAHKLRQVDTIFLFTTKCSSIESSPINLKTPYSKIVIVSDDKQQLVDSITNRNVELSKQHDLFNLFNHKQQAFCNLSKSSTSFLWFQLFKKMLIDMPKEDIDLDKNDQAKKLLAQSLWV